MEAITKSEATRKARIDKVKGIIASAINQGIELNEEEFVIKCSYEFGVTKRTFKEYLEIAVNLTGTKTEDGFIKRKAWANNEIQGELK